MRTCIADIEANNFLYGVSKVFCIAVKDATTGKNTLFEPDEIPRALEYIQSFDRVVFHNGCGYDLPVLEKLYAWKFEGEVVDTLVLSRLNWPTLKSHALKAWGENLTKRGIINVGKTEYDNFEYYEPEMGEYCQQDVEVTHAVYKFLTETNGFNKGRVIDPSEDYVKLEQDIVTIQTKAEQYGVSFDYDTAMKLSQQIGIEMDDIYKEVSEKLGYSWEIKQHNLKKDGTLSHHAVNLLAKLGREFPEFEHEVSYSTEVGVSEIQVPTKITLDTKKLLIERLLELDWKPTMHTEKGSPQITRQGDVCPKLPEEFKDVGKYFVLKHRKALIDGFFKNVRSDGKIPSEANTLGAVTGRYTHRKIANLPAVRSLYGKEIRALFGVEEDRVQVGSDLAGIEARMLAHSMGDDEYTKEVLDGDIHTANQIAAGLPTRDSAKTFFYGFLYGAGNEKVGQLVNGSAKEGASIKERFLQSLPSLKQLIEEKQDEAKAGYITSLDGRPVYITRSEGFDGKKGYDVRKALNSLLQSSATIFFKRWIWYVDMLTKSYRLDAKLMISYHDEGQWSVGEQDVDRFSIVLQDALELTDNYYKVKCKNDIDTKTGINWMETH